MIKYNFLDSMCVLKISNEYVLHFFYFIYLFTLDGT